MANFSSKSKYYILSQFRSFPKTSKIEGDRENLITEFNKLKKFEKSQDLADFRELQAYLESKEHAAILDRVKKEQAVEAGKLKSYQDQKKSKPFKTYFAFNESAKYKSYNTFSESKELADYLDLEELVNSDEFKKKLKDATSEAAKFHEKENSLKRGEKSTDVKFFRKFNQSGKFKKFEKISESKELADFRESKEEVKKSSDIKFWEKFSVSARYKRFLSITDSKEYKNFLALEKEVNSGEFKSAVKDASGNLSGLNEKIGKYESAKKSSSIKGHYKFENSAKYKAFINFQNSKQLADYFELGKYLGSDEYKKKLAGLENEGKVEGEKIRKADDFKNAETYKWYLGVKDSDKFDDLKTWEITFEDDFSDKIVDKEKWMNRYFWGDKFLDETYALETDVALPSDGSNLKMSNSILQIEVRKESKEGKVWQKPFGFLPKQFEYTTDMISTGKSFRQKFGRFEAKIRVNYAKPVRYNFWMASDKILPHVDIMRMDKKKSKVEMSHHWGDVTKKEGPEKATSQMKGLDVTQDFFIYTLEWSKDKLVWKINGIVVNEQSRGIPDEEMYLVFSAGLDENPGAGKLPASMEVDWIRCYQEKK
ncbi:MAG: family 16 glycosylhydrolase [Bacteroidales bacterium]|nr:family 16 glycosylhydrolase [Bacteroidales bacterium]